MPETQESSHCTVANDESRYYVFQTGCGIIRTSARRCENYLHSHGIQQADKWEDADYIVIDTCAVDNRSIGHATERIYNCTHNHPRKPKVIVAGCLVDYDRPRVEAMFDGPILSLSEIMQNPDPFGLGEPYASEETPYFFPTKKGNIFSSGKQASEYCLINICTGCLHRCTYCIHPLIFGKPKSVPPEAILDTIRMGIAKDVKEFILWAQDIYAYGRDIQSDIVQLLSSILQIEGDFTLNLGGLHPRFVPKVIVPFTELLKSGKIIKMEFDIQTGSPRLLKLMGRKYNPAQLKNGIQAFRTIKPDLMIHTHVMLGFPTESDADVAQTIDVLLNVGFTSVSVFAFSPHPRTRAFHLQPRIPSSLVKERFAMLERALEGKQITIINYTDEC